MSPYTAQVITKEAKDALGEYPKLLQRLLFNRGIMTAEQAHTYLNPDYATLHDPFLLSDMDQAVARIIQAFENQEKIAIYGDYDADGIPGSVVLHDFFKKIGYENFVNYIPHRHEEGYGLHEEALDELVSQDVALVITVDLGISAVDSAKYAEDLGLDLIITDHHIPDADNLPEAVAIVNPKLGDYPDPMLCGAAVAFKLVQALIHKSDKLPSSLLSRASTLVERRRGQGGGAIKKEDILGWSKWLLDMVGIATISDMVPLKNENRIFAHFGLRVLRKSNRRGLKRLFQKTRVNQTYLTEDDIGFMITPRLNAASRMAHPMDAFRVLANNGFKDIDEAVDHLVHLNDERKVLVASIMREVNKDLGKRELREVIVIGNPEWSQGVLGIVAAKIVETYARPAFVWSVQREGVVKGSCRTDGSVSVMAMMQELHMDTLSHFGGHEGAGGFAIPFDRVHTLEDELVSVYGSVSEAQEGTVGDALFIDDTLTLNQVTADTYKLIERCAPFGVANQKPLFRFEQVTVSAIKMFGKGKEHIEILLEGQSPETGFQKQKPGFGGLVKAIAFFKTPKDFTRDFGERDTVTLLAHFEKSYFAGKQELRLRIIDIL